MITNEDIHSYLEPNSQQPDPHFASIDLLPPYAQQLVEHYGAESNVRAIMTVGSLSTRQKDEHSDIDLILICEDGIPTPKQRMEVIDFISKHTATITSFDQHIWNFGTGDDFIIDSQEICTQFFTKEYIENKVELTVRGFYTEIGMEHPLAGLSSILNATVHIDKDGFYEQLKTKIEPYPPQLQKIIVTQELRMRLPYYLNRLETAIARNDIPFANKVIQHAIDSALYIVFAWRGTYPNGPKRLYKQIDAILEESLAKELKENLENLYAQETTSTTLLEKRERLVKIQEFLHKLIEGLPS